MILDSGLLILGHPVYIYNFYPHRNFKHSNRWFRILGHT